jgi:DNA gyrase/topoisomerase IV subunit B
VGPGAGSGTTIAFWPDTEIFETTRCSFAVLAERFRQVAFLNPGLSITLTDERPSGEARAVIAEPEQWPAMTAEQNRQVTLGEQAGNRALLLAAATAIGIVAEYLMAAAIAARRRRWLRWPAAAAVVSVALAAIAFV